MLLALLLLALLIYKIIFWVDLVHLCGPYASIIYWNSITPLKFFVSESYVILEGSWLLLSSKFLSIQIFVMPMCCRNWSVSLAYGRIWIHCPWFTCSSLDVPQIGIGYCFDFNMIIFALCLKEKFHFFSFSSSPSSLMHTRTISLWFYSQSNCKLIFHLNTMSCK